MNKNLDGLELKQPEKKVLVIKKNGSLQPWNSEKIVIAADKSAYRALTNLKPKDAQKIVELVVERIDASELTEIPINQLHNYVEAALEYIHPVIAKSYRDYRNYKQDFLAPYAEKSYNKYVAKYIEKCHMEKAEAEVLAWEDVKKEMEQVTASFGITALNELQQLYNGNSLAEDGEFALDTLRHINEKINEFKDEDGRLYAIYGTPAENLCGLQIKQFRKKYGIIENVSDREYVSNSFHCHVSEVLTPTEKQDKEYRFWELANGGKIQYVKYPIDYNINAIKALIRRAMDMGLYEGVNMSLAYCEECGHQELEMDVCPVCGSTNLTKIDRMNGYLSFSRVHGDTRLNDAKMAELKDRKSM